MGHTWTYDASAGADGAWKQIAAGLNGAYFNRSIKPRFYYQRLA